MDPGYFYFLLIILKSIQQILDKILNLFIGYQTQWGWQIEKEISISNYEYSAQIVNIKARGAFTVACTHQLNNFLYTHHKYVNPKLILQSDNIMLHGCTPTHLFFSITNKNDLNETRNHPFLMISHFILSEKLLILPHWAFQRLIEEHLKDDLFKQKDLILIGNTGRCGSTLLCQMFNNLPDTLVMSEPWPLVHAHEWYNRGYFEAKQYQQLIWNMVKIIYKPRISKNYIRMVLKLPMINMPQYELIKNSYPEIKLIMATRHPKASSLAYCRFFQAGVFKLFEKYQRKNFWYNNAPFDYHNNKLQNLRKHFLSIRNELTNDEDNCCYYAASLECYLKNKNLYNDCIIYEKMMDNPQLITKRLFSNLNINEKYLQLALNALDKDSQNKIFTTDYYSKFITNEGFEKINSIFKQIDLPIHLEMTLQQFTKICQLNS